MQLSKIHSAVWIIPAVLVALGVFGLPYGYYQFLRLETCLVTAFLAYSSFKTFGVLDVWTLSLAMVAILFNPFLPLHLGKEIWVVLDVAAAVLLLAHYAYIRRARPV